MAGITKRVNIKAPVAVRNITPPIYGTCNNIIMTSGDILKCLCKRAQVEEILPNGSIVKITMKNYYTDNGAGLNAYAWNPEAIEEPKTTKNDEDHIKFANTEITGKDADVDNLEANDPEVAGEPDAIAPAETTEDAVVDTVETVDVVENAEPVVGDAEEAPVVDVVESDETKVETGATVEEAPAETTEDIVVDSVEDTKVEAEETPAEVVEVKEEVVDEAKKPVAAPKKKTSTNKKSTKK